MGFALSDYHFDLPPELIAQRPVEPRDHSRLLVLHRDRGQIEHRQFRDLPQYYQPGDLFIANNSRVITARLLGKRNQSGSGKVEFFLLRQENGFPAKPQCSVWMGLWKARASAQVGMTFEIPTASGQLKQSLQGELIKVESGLVWAKFAQDPIPFGQMPLPPYIERSEVDPSDGQRYQTVYGSRPGSVAAPTAGLHFTAELLQTMRSQGLRWEELTLHVGLGTFRPVKSQDIRDHSMHSEHYHLSAGLIDRLLSDRSEITAVGTTSLRVLESWAALKSHEQRGDSSGLSGETNIFIYPPYTFKRVSRLITNFHLPQSTLFMLVCAFAGADFTRYAYAEAIREKYRFYSYGDAMLIL